MWLLDGLHYYSALVLRRLDGLSMIGKVREPICRSPRLYVRILKSRRQNLLMLKGAYPQNRQHQMNTPKRRNKRFWPQTLLIALLVPILVGCFSFKSKKQTDPPPPQRKFECLDKALENCQGVTPRKTINDAGVVAAIASEALTRLTECSNKHAELVKCVVDFKKPLQK